MRNYLSQIVTRANGEFGPDSAKPVARNWSGSSALDIPDPFEEIVEPPADVVSSEKLIDTESFSEDREPLISRQTRRDSIPPYSAVPPASFSEGQAVLEQGKRLLPPTDPTPGQTDENVPSSLPEGDPVVASPSADEMSKPAIREPDAARKAEKANRQDSERIEQAVSPVFNNAAPKNVSEFTFDTRLTRRQFVTQSKSVQRPVTGEKQDVSMPAEPDEHSDSELWESRPSTRLLTGEEGADRSNDLVLPLQPRPLSSPISSSIFQRESREPRLVIGRLQVEVITPSPVTTEKETVHVISHAPEPRREASVSRSKLRFGLGQI